MASLLIKHFIHNKIGDQTQIIAYAWKSIHGIHAGKLNLKFGMKQIENRGKIWKDQCDKSFACPYFNGSCECESILFST